MRYATEDSACFDVESREVRIMAPGDTHAFPTGLYVKDIIARLSTAQRVLIFLLKFFGIIAVIEILPRSGLSLKTGLRVANSPGQVDLDFDQEIKVILHSVAEEQVTFVDYGDRIAQCRLTFVLRPAKVIKGGKRTGGFGSTGT